MCLKKDLIKLIWRQFKIFEKRWQRDTAAIWSEWSECDNSLVRSRRRNCTDCDKREETSPCISENNFQKEFPAITTEIEKDLIPIPKKIAKSFDSAKMLQKSATKIPEDEASLFAENDYENQNEISYFAGEKSLKIHSMSNQNNNIDDSPMIKQMETEESNNNFFNSVQEQTYNIRNSPTAHPNLGEGVAVVEFPDEIQQQQRQNFEGLRLLPTSTTTPKSIGQKAVQLSPLETSDSFSKSNECNPREDCCPLVDMSNRKNRGCTLGYKINQYNQQEGCVPESCKNKVPSQFALF
uniref:Uncharacterized protein n=1 Tax=Panagrolaimus davidi TaxID=227884 RepID=A0A914PTD1_9BILA